MERKLLLPGALRGPDISASGCSGEQQLTGHGAEDPATEGTQTRSETPPTLTELFFLFIRVKRGKSLNPETFHKYALPTYVCSVYEV